MKIGEKLKMIEYLGRAIRNESKTSNLMSIVFGMNWKENTTIDFTLSRAHKGCDHATFFLKIKKKQSLNLFYVIKIFCLQRSRVE